MFQAAIERGRVGGTGAAAVPAGRRYAHRVRRVHRDETLLRSLRRILAVPRLGVSVSIEAAIHPDTGASRRALARLAGRAVQAGMAGAHPVAPAIPFAARAQPTAADSGTAPYPRGRTLPEAPVRRPGTAARPPDAPAGVYRERRYQQCADHQRVE